MIGAGFPLIGTVAGGLVRTLGYGVGVTYDTLGRVVNPLLTAVTKTAALDPLVLPAIAKGFISFDTFDKINKAMFSFIWKF